MVVCAILSQAGELFMYTAHRKHWPWTVVLIQNIYPDLKLKKKHTLLLARPCMKRWKEWW